MNPTALTEPKNSNGFMRFFGFILYRLSSFLGSTIRPSLILSNVAGNQDTQAVGNTCVKVIIKSQTTNTGTIWVNFGAAAVVGQCYDLVPGSVLAGPCNNTNKIHALFTVANEKLIIFYTI